MIVSAVTVCGDSAGFMYGNYEKLNGFHRNEIACLKIYCIFTKKQIGYDIIEARKPI